MTAVLESEVCDVFALARIETAGGKEDVESFRCVSEHDRMPFAIIGWVG